MRRSLCGILVWGALLSGCQGPSTPTSPAALPLVGQTVEIVVPADLALKELWEPLLQEWRAQTGGNATWSEYESVPWSGENVTSEKPAGGRLVLLPLEQLADAEAAGWLSPLPTNVAEQVDGKDLFPGLKDVLSRQKRLMAIPVSAPVLLCYYRKDLLDAAGLKPPLTWDDYQALVEKLPQWAPELMALEPCGPGFLASLFLARSAAFAKHPQNYSVWFDIQTGDPLFDSPALERSLDAARAAWKQMPAEVWQSSPSDCRRQLLVGKAALVLSFEPASAYPRVAEPGETSGEPLAIGVCRLPGTSAVYQRDGKRWENLPADQLNQPGFVGFTGLVMGVQAASEQAGAWDLLRTLRTRQDQAFAERPRSICRESEATAGSDSGALPPETAGQLADATAETLRRRDVVFDLPIPAAKEIREIIAKELTAIRDDSRTSAEILAALQEKITAATNDRRAELRDAYRRSAGLGPVK